MIRNTLYILCFFVFLCFYTSSYSQGFETIHNSIPSENSITQRLPPLAELLETAERNAPILKMYKANIERNKAKEKNVKREWQRYMGIEANARYGLLDNFVLADEQYDYSSTKSTNTEENRYYVGIFARIPLSAIIDRSNLKYARHEIEMVRQQRLARLKELREDVIIYYNDVIKTYNQMILRNNMCESYNIQVLRAKKDYVNGNIPYSEYARLNEMYTKASIELESIKVDYHTALQLLQELVGSPIKLKNSSLE